MRIELEGGQLKVDISAALSANQVEELIYELALARAEMEPVVPHEAPAPGKGNPDQPVLLEDDPSMNLAMRSNGHFRLWIRNRGIGWMAYNLPLAKACGIRDFLIARTPRPDAVSNFFSEEGSGGHKAN